MFFSSAVGPQVAEQEVPEDRRPEVWPFVTGATALLQRRPRFCEHHLHNTFPWALPVPSNPNTPGTV